MANSILAEQSLFSSLHIWARHQDENFCTEGLICLLRLMLKDAPTQALEIISWLTTGLIGSDTPANSIRISGQVTSDEGRPDIEITSPSKTAWIEVKVDSKVGPNQLERYRRDLYKKTGEVRLVLLSRSTEVLARENQPDISRRWLDLSTILSVALRSMQSPTKASVLLEDYLEFLGTRQMKLNRISETAAHSISEVATILSQLELACSTAGIKFRFAATKTWLGFSLGSSTCSGWIGFNITDPQWLFFTTDGSPDEGRIVLELTQKCSLPGGHLEGKHWTNSIDLVNCTDYLHASAADQVEYLRRHLIEESLTAFQAMLSPLPNESGALIPLSPNATP